ncbi:N-acetylglucosamine-6-phosphate deacetylase [Paramesorhizobium deserti]|uniref:N-acetylglucosamine-6-phosphate deacetylase n=1 Tax=Paramesorhizobium deserti TaxID=1494590 RepID=A0A135HTD6_9HYPH|nr:N-acetylglucosamine-6-phosphate deacetylase [Paramesorhizobium deserti]KXF76433.1 N-acetylglucosamine-6-phosphate deacetylase [Paramesorhizobium deserti]
MSEPFALTAPRIFDGERWLHDKALILRDGLIEAVVARNAVPTGIRTISVHDGMIVPGFIDLQVNGGGGVLLNEQPDLDAIRTICAAHAKFGTVGLLPTLITDTREITAATIAAGEEAAREKVPGFLGLHLEGPHLSVKRKGTHHPALIRPMEDADLARLIEARKHLPVLLTTVAPENTTNEQIEALAAAGIIVSLGHSDCAYSSIADATRAGASVVTHLFNAMSPLGHREPGMVGAALDLGSLNVGLIADGFHVDPAAIRIALRAKTGPGHIFLVTDAMSTIGTDMTSFTLNGRMIYRADGRLTLEDGTLAGADLDMISAVRFMHRVIGLPLEEALRMASLYPAQSIGVGDELGTLRKGMRASFLHLDDELDVKRTVIDGQIIFGGPFE